MKNNIDRDALSRVIAVINGKGGVGKTAVTSHAAAMIAAVGHDVLVVDMDPGAGLATDLGYKYTEANDQGLSLSNALMAGTEVRVVKGVRKGLDVIVGGDHLFEASHYLAGQRGKRLDPRLALARVLSPIAGDYDFVFLDCPPGDDTLQVTALGAARWTLIPTRGDAASNDSVRGVERRLAQIVDINPDIDMLGANLFDVDMQARTARVDARVHLVEVIGDESDAFNAIIRHTLTPAQQARAQGLLINELKPRSRSSRLLTKDYQALSKEIVERLIEKEKEEES